MDPDALREMVRRVVREEMTGVDRAATVTAVNGDGTVTLDLGGGVLVPVQPAMASYSPRKVGDRVLVRNRGGEQLVLGKVGAATVIPEPAQQTVVTVSDVAPPTGQGWEEVVTGQVWLKPYAVWGKRVTPAPPPPAGGTYTLDAVRFTTYRSGGQIATDHAEQGDWSGRGLCTGLATFVSGAWAPISGRTATGGRLRIRRSPSGHGFTYLLVPATIHRALATDPPPSTPTLDSSITYQISAALGETKPDPPGLVVSAAFCQAFCAGTASALAFFSSNARDNIEIVGATLSIDYV